MSARTALATTLILAIALPCLAAQPAKNAKADDPLDVITKRLAGAKVTIEADKEHPDKVFDLIRNAANVNIVIEPAVRRRWETETVTLKLKDVSALSAFYHVVRNLDLVAAYANEAFVITTPDKAQPHPQVTIYDIRDMVTPPRGNRQPPSLFGAQVDPLFYRYHERLGAVSGTKGSNDPFADLELVDRYPADPIGEVIADIVQEQARAKGLGVSVSYRAGYLVVVEQPKATRLPLTPSEIKKARTDTSAK